MRIVLIIVLGILSHLTFAPPEQVTIKSWVDLKFDSMTMDERISQLYMIEVRPTYGKAHLDLVRKQIENHQVGGVIFFKGKPEEQVDLTNLYQSISKTPLFVAIDGEWGLSMRLSNTPEFPYQLGLGGINGYDNIYEMGREIGRQCKRMGIHINFAPVVDVNNNPKNPVIGYRSFGEDPQNVCDKGWAYAAGMQDEGVIACAKHFPGHGDTDVDSHKDLPVINHSMKRLEEIEFVPFRYFINQGVKSIMTAHLYIPAIDNTPNTAISISEKGINGLLREKFGFLGLAFTDALNMKGVSKFNPDGLLEYKALKAGNDILLAPGDMPKATKMIKDAMLNGNLDSNYVYGKVKKILAYKFALGLDNPTKVEKNELLEDLNNSNAQYLKYQLAEEQLCLLKDDANAIPLTKLQNKKIVSVSVGNGTKTKFQTFLEKRGIAKHLHISKNASPQEFNRVLDQLLNYDYAVISLQKTSKYPPNFGMTRNAINFLNAAPSKTKTILVNFGNPYGLAKIKNQKSVLLAYEDKEEHELKAARALFGEVSVDAKLAVSVNQEYKINQGLEIKVSGDLMESTPDEVGLSSKKLAEIDKIIQRAIKERATPGAQVFIAKNNKIVYHKTFGKPTYETTDFVSKEQLYDLASLTKVLSTTLAVMKLVENNGISLDDKLSKYLTDLQKTDKKNITIRDVLEHRSGLKDWIPFYLRFKKDHDLFNTVFCSTTTNEHGLQVCENLFMRADYKQTMLQEIYDSKLGTYGRYVYSDLGLILLKEVIEIVTNTTLDRYVYDHFYDVLDIKRLRFYPLKYFGLDEIIPTEMDGDVRSGLIQGFVHDPAAAFLGGMSGHAGLFGNSESVGRILQMLNNGGVLNNIQVLKPETIKQFTKRQRSSSRRGLGWDKADPNKISPYSMYASADAFGHTGFTGTMAFSDPKYDLVFVFLSNRIYPTSENRKLIKMGTRREILDVIYKSMK
jgi:beta-glucosidase-like glycosyl hydrolase/CubicO group peptidase (beta-lactamase class C family)